MLIVRGRNWKFRNEVLLYELQRHTKTAVTLWINGIGKLLSAPERSE
jgi:hypothetical protein